VNGPNPDPWQVRVQWVDLSDLDAARLYPKVLSKVLPDLDHPRALYIGDVNRPPSRAAKRPAD
jgi:hypothetical protein